MSMCITSQATTSTPHTGSNPITIDSMMSALKELEILMKIDTFNKNNNGGVAYFPPRLRRPRWLIKGLKIAGIKTLRSSLVPDGKFYLLNPNKFYESSWKPTPLMNEDL